MAIAVFLGGWLIISGNPQNYEHPTPVVITGVALSNKTLTRYDFFKSSVTFASQTLKII
jgi:hypothetical protein